MDLTNLIEETGQALGEARVDLELLLATIESQRQLITDLEDELHGLRLAATRRGAESGLNPDATVVPINAAIDLPANSAKNLSEVSRSDAVAHALSMTDRPLDRQAIQARLQTLGRIGDTVDQISLALTNLKRSGRAVKVGGGRWRATLSSAQG